MCEQRIANWNNTVISYPDKVWYPRRAKDIPTIINQAILQNKRLRVVGPSRHTWSQISSTDDHGWAICMKKINGYRLNLDQSLVRVGAGLTLDKLNQYLEKDGYHLENMGGAMKQSIGGLIATATHGSGVYGSFSDLVETVELYTSACPNKRLIISRNHQDFPALCTHLGVLGVITHVVLRVVPLYNIKMTSKVVDQVDLNRLFEHEYYHVLYFSHLDQLVEYTGDRTPAHSSKLAQLKDSLSDELRNSAQELLVHLTRVIPQSIPFFQRLAARTVNNQTREDIGYRVLTTSDAHGVYNFQSVVDMEFALPAEEAQATYEIIREYLRQFPDLPVAGSWRFVPSSQAWMAPTYGRDTCCIDLVFLRKEVPSEILEGIYRLMVNRGARPHWGKWNIMNSTDLQRVYPKEAIQAFEDVRNRYDPEKLFLNDYTRKIFG